MLFLLGEKIVSKTEPVGTFDCPICKGSKRVLKVEDKSYFTLFLIRTFPLDTVAEYTHCEGCGHAFASKDASEPSYFEPLKTIIAYLVAGFGLEENIETVSAIYTVSTGKDISRQELYSAMAAIQQNNQLHEDLKQDAKSLSWVDKVSMIEAAYLVVFTAGEVNYEERLQVNLLANALGIGIEGVNEIIKGLQSRQYKGFSAGQMQG
ncbi:zinc-ribbon domain-containing protein [Paraferrimonas sedimenticola]|uniref:Zinc-ribbon 15 domain-containing protein n=1 Tax=Paraferrimonas sedimenticola TaxID=375674 RepID=A0AA37RVK2_9GAMM|nr:zinc-ribbon domain-containing protein [Paraferrimonas sedimenticola]GLP96180.1 hypothetical protein GCM10007895_14860 [Paraferrimonas sedimenticola]